MAITTVSPDRLNNPDELNNLINHDETTVQETSTIDRIDPQILASITPPSIEASQNSPRNQSSSTALDPSRVQVENSSVTESGSTEARSSSWLTKKKIVKLVILLLMLSAAVYFSLQGVEVGSILTSTVALLTLDNFLERPDNADQNLARRG